jgi:acyl-CoA thioesterase
MYVNVSKSPVSSPIFGGEKVAESLVNARKMVMLRMVMLK